MEEVAVGFVVLFFLIAVPFVLGNGDFRLGYLSMFIASCFVGIAWLLGSLCIWIADSFIF